jgi:sulfur relay (sulfurtransferase) DsrF/TusC family protein
MKKTTTIIISQSPLKSLRVFEALRMGVGLTLCNDAVQVLFIDDGVFAFLQTDADKVAMPEYARHIETLKQLGHRICAEHESLSERGIGRPSHEPEIISRSDVPGLLLDCDGVIRY